MLLARHQGHRVRPRRGGSTEQRVNRGPALERRATVGGFDRKLLALGGREPGQLAERHLRPFEQRAEQGLEAVGPAPDGGRVEEVAAEFNLAAQLLAAPDEGEREVELGALGHRAQALDREAREAEVRLDAALVGDQHLDQRRAVEAALGDQRLDQLLERQVLVGEGGERPLAGPRRQRGEARPAGKVGAQHQGVDEQADQPLGLAPVAAGHRAADEQLALAAQPAEEGLDRGRQQHEAGRPQLAPAPREPDGDRRRQAEGEPATSTAATAG